MENDWTPPGWDWDVRLASVETSKPGFVREVWNIHGTCRSCGSEIFTARSGEYVPSRDSLIESLDGFYASHQDQHRPGHAPDVEISWTLDADCTVCEDGGGMRVEDGQIVCAQCGTTWCMDGTRGVLA